MLLSDCAAAGRDRGSLLSEPEKELRKIRKKLKQIDELKAKQARGEAIEINQVSAAVSCVVAPSFSWSLNVRARCVVS